MTKTRNNKLGFTLVEMVVVIAIVAILATVLLVGITTLITVADERSGKVQQHSQKFDAAGQDVSLSLKADYSDIKTWKSDDPYWADDDDDDSLSGGSSVVNNDGGSYFDLNDDDGDEAVDEESEANDESEVIVEEEVVIEEPKEEITPVNSNSASTDLSANPNLSGDVNLGNANSVNSSSEYYSKWGREVYKVNLSGSGNIYSVTFKLDGGNVSYNQNWNWKYNNCENLGDGVFRVTYNANNNSCKPDNSMTMLFESDSNVSVTVQSVSYYND